MTPSGRTRVEPLQSTVGGRHGTGEQQRRAGQHDDHRQQRRRDGRSPAADRRGQPTDRLAANRQLVPGQKHHRQCQRQQIIDDAKSQQASQHRGRLRGGHNSNRTNSKTPAPPGTCVNSTVTTASR